jgi:hypothetical protein
MLRSSLLRQMACIESFLPTGAKVLHYFGLDCRMLEVGGLEVFLYTAALNFELFSNIEDKN